MRYLIFIFLMLMSRLGIAVNSDIEKEIASQLNIKNFVALIPPQKITDYIFTPYAVQAIRENDMMPSCVLVGNNLNRTLMLIAPSDGQFANCHQVLNSPLISKINGGYYATYTYVVEDPRAVFVNSYQVIKLTEDGFYQCKEDETISEMLGKMLKMKMKLKVAIDSIIKKTGCTVEK